MKALVIGYGSIGKRHIENLSNQHNTKILVYTHRNYDNSLRKKKCDVFKSLNACILEKPDFAIICNETSLHYSTALKLAKAGINIMIEKPLSSNLNGIKNLLNVISRKKLITFMGCPLRFHPCIMKIREIINKKEIGKILSVHVENGSYLPDWHPDEDYRQSYAARKDLGGGVVLTNIHEIDYLYWFFGKVTEVFSITGKFSDLDINVEDLSSILMRFDNNVVAEIHLDYFQKPDFRSCKIIGNKGTVYWNSQTNTVKVYNNKKEKWVNRLKVPRYNKNSMYVDELAHFLNCVNKKKKSINPVSDGAKILKIALSLKQASKTKKMVKINE